jgi:cytochrome c5
MPQLFSTVIKCLRQLAVYFTNDQRLPMKKLLIVACALFATSAMADPIMDKYNKSCGVCHSSGAANAPKTGDVAAWEPRMAKGMEALVQSVKTGLNAMPPKGMCFDCTDDEYNALIEYMAKPAS